MNVGSGALVGRPRSLAGLLSRLSCAPFSSPLPLPPRTCTPQVLPVGTRLGPAEIGLLATVGAASVRAYPRPLVAVLSTGDEVVEVRGI